MAASDRLIEWVRQLGAPCERWAENGFPITAELCADPAYAWAMLFSTGTAAFGLLVGLAFSILRRPPRWLVTVAAAALLVLATAAMIAGARLFVAAASLYAPELLRAMSQPWFAAPALLLAMLLYRMRCTARFAYGLIELFVGIVTLVAVTRSATVTEVGASLQAKGLGLAGGVYIVVRGLDNMDNGLPQSWRRRWNLLFRGLDTSQSAGGVALTRPTAESREPPRTPALRRRSPPTPPPGPPG